MRLCTVARHAVSSTVVIAVAIALWTLDPAALALVFSTHAAPYLALAVVATLIATWLGLVGWRLLLAELPARAAYRIFAASLLTKYLPGRLWALLTHIQMGRAAGVGAGRMTSAFLLSFSVMSLAGATVSTVAAPAQLGAAAWWLAIPVTALAVCFAHPRLVERIHAKTARLLRRPVPPPGVASERRLRWSIVANVGFWVFSGLQLWAIVVLVGAEPGRALPVSVGSFALASLLGVLVFFLPDGWGAREVALAAALSTILPVPEAATAAVASRVVQVLSEVALSGVVLLVTVRRRPLPAQVPAAATGRR